MPTLERCAMASRRSSRVPVIALVLALVALPALAGTRPVEQPEKGFLEALVGAFAELVPAAARLTGAFLPEAEAPGDERPEPVPADDLGPGLDPLG